MVHLVPIQVPVDGYGSSHQVKTGDDGEPPHSLNPFVAGKERRQSEGLEGVALVDVVGSN